MNLYLLTHNEKTGYEDYESAVVVARSESEAVTIHPNGPGHWQDKWPVWASSSENVTAKLLGKALPETNRVQVICVGRHVNGS